MLSENGSSSGCPYGSNVKPTDAANSWVMCFDDATFSIWSSFGQDIEFHLDNNKDRED